MTGEAETAGRGVRAAPSEVWDAVRADYLAGLSASECCRRHGVGMTSLRDRAAREGWRRSDQPWTPPDALDPWDEGVELEAEVGGDLDKVGFNQLAYVAHRRMMRAVMRGDATEALRWRRVRLIMDEEEAEVLWDAARHDAEIWRARNAEESAADDPDRSDRSDGSDGVFESAPDV